MKKFWGYFKNIFGIPHNSKYVKNYLDEANMRSGIYMSAVIVLLEIWLVIRQVYTYIIPKVVNENKPLFTTVFKSTQSFWLLMSMGMVMLWYSLLYIAKEHHKSKMALGTLIAVSVSLTFAALMPFEFQNFSFSSTAGITTSILTITYYILIIAFAIVTTISTLFIYKKRVPNKYFGIAVIAMFSLTCLIFGIRVSYIDFFGLTSSGQQYKMIICFMMMSIYVGCLLIWKPYISLAILGTIFLGFYFLLTIPALKANDRPFPEGDLINYITFFISLVMVCFSIYNQRHKEAEKDERLELLATRDALTGLYSFNYYTSLVNRKIHDENIKIDTWIYLFLDITSFKVFNDQRGFEEGNRFLKEVGSILMKYLDDGLVSRQSDDHFVAFVPNKEDIDERLVKINDEIEKLDLDIRPGVKVGKYVFRDPNEDPHASIEKARYACSEIKHIAGSKSIFYDTKMHDAYRLVQYIVRHVDEAIEKGYVQISYQPLINAKDGNVCAAEALARWNDPTYGSISPAIFISALEDAQLIYKLDEAILRMVCRDLCSNLDAKIPSVPVSVNISRLDFVLVDLVEIIEQVVKEYNVPRNLIYIEITESALMENEEVLKKTISRLQEDGFQIWLDDFGSGYSSFNVLKDYNFNGLKLDMKFLKGFGQNEKSKIVIKSVIAMAKELGIHTLCEGVETMEQAEFLKEAQCERFQGYLFGKPQTFDQLKAKTISKEYILSKKG